ncbi:glutathione S-transferase family protein [Phenylobacterium sp.]|uniref:glutathione S-transferase family protein n=1 Tax=Phenylobacterium sp. TaxID=1871053 RepID=UPI0035B0EF33
MVVLRQRFQTQSIIRGERYGAKAIDHLWTDRSINIYRLPFMELSVITLFAANTPNGHKISIALEEMALPYEVRRMAPGDLASAEFRSLNPNGKIPVIVDRDGQQVVYESNAILLYLSEKADMLMPRTPDARIEALQLLFFQAASIGPMFGQRAHFTKVAPERPPTVVERFTAEGARLEAVMDEMLTGRDYFAGEYSIVDISIFGWLNASVAAGFAIDERARLKAWFDRVAARAAVQRGIRILAAPSGVAARPGAAA